MSTSELPIILRRDGDSFGFTLRGNQWPFFIEKVLEGGAAHGAGVQTGDMIVKINEQPLSGLSLIATVKMIKASGDLLNLQLRRNAKPSPYQMIAHDIMNQARPEPKTKSNPQKKRQEHEERLQEAKPTVSRTLSKPALPPKPKSVVLTLVNDSAELSRVGQRHQELNQDNKTCFTIAVPSGTQSAVIAGVFDGHGLLGERASLVAAEKLKEICTRPSFNAQEFVASPESATKAMKQLFDELHARVIAEHDNPPQTYEYPGHSSSLSFMLTGHKVFGKAYSCGFMNPPAPIDFGCTAVVAVVYNSFVCVGNAGDAGCILCMPSDDDAPARVLTERHNALERVEVERINRDFGDKAQITQDGYLAPLDPDISQYEVQTTRCLGHRLLGKAGIISDPYVCLTPLRDAKGLVLFSDGISDELQPRDIADRVVDASSAAEAADTLCRDAQEFCMDSTKIDDCTVVVLRLSQTARGGDGESSTA